MAAVTIRRVLDLVKDPSSLPVVEPIFLRQGEEGDTEIVGEIYSDGTAFSLTNYSAIFTAMVGNNVVTHDATVSGNTATYTLTSDLTSVSGKARLAYFRFQGTSGNVCSACIPIFVEACADPSAPAQDEYRSAFDELLEYAQNQIAGILEIATDAQDALDKMTGSIDEAVERADTAAQNANEAAQGVSDAIADAVKDVGDAVNTANTAAQNANAAAQGVSDAIADAVKDVNEATNTANTAAETANAAAETANAAAQEAASTFENMALRLTDNGHAIVTI